MMNFKMPKTL